MSKKHDPQWARERRWRAKVAQPKKRRKDSMPKKHDPKKLKRWCAKEAQPKKRERESVKIRSRHHLVHQSDQVVNISIISLRIQSLILQQEWCKCVPSYSLPSSTSAIWQVGKKGQVLVRIHIWVTLRDPIKRVRPWIIYFVQNFKKSQTCSKIWKVLGSGCSNHQQSKTVRKKFKGSQAKAR